MSIRTLQSPRLFPSSIHSEAILSVLPPIPRPLVIRAPQPLPPTLPLLHLPAFFLPKPGGIISTHLLKTLTLYKIDGVYSSKLSIAWKMKREELFKSKTKQRGKARMHCAPCTASCAGEKRKLLWRTLSGTDKIGTWNKKIGWKMLCEW